jgi:sulfatase-like protein
VPKTAKPNILVIWGDDIGMTNLSCYSSGLMGYRTPNIDRLANEGMRFTDSYGEQELHRRPLLVHHRAERLSHRSLESRRPGLPDRQASRTSTRCWTSGDEKSRWPRAQTWRRLREGGRQVPSGDGRVA